jgi:predicted nucleotide-binding protein (sugar kinase/HSP70/actin superfamily)
MEETIDNSVACREDCRGRSSGRADSFSQHYRRPAERPFTAEERHKVTLLFGGLTPKHEKFIRSVFEGSGYRCENLPTADRAAYHTGREFCNIGMCNPTYFTVGNLVQFLRKLEQQGLSREQIRDQYVFFTAGSCGPCRFGMYESEYRQALDNAGLQGFRVLLFQQMHGVEASTGETGLRFTVDLGLGLVNALILGDVVHELLYAIRPYEVRAGESNAVIAEVADILGGVLAEREWFEVMQQAPAWCVPLLQRKPGWRRWLNVLGKMRQHLGGKRLRDALQACAERVGRIEVDRLRVRPVVKIVGEFWAQTTEGDGNFNMFSYLEREGAEVRVEPVSGWVMYLLFGAKAQALYRRGLEETDSAESKPKWRRWVTHETNFWRKWLLLSLGERIWSQHYRRVAGRLGGLAPPLVSQTVLANLAAPYYHPLARGGEGHLEVGKSIYYTQQGLSHMVLSLKPFGCMPSIQSDGVMAAVLARHKEMIFLPIETSGEGEINAYSRVLMALTEARVRAKEEFEQALNSTGRSLPDIRNYVADHPDLRRALYLVPRRRGVAGTAANFVLHVGGLMDGRARPPR